MGNFPNLIWTWLYYCTLKYTLFISFLTNINYLCPAYTHIHIDFDTLGVRKNFFAKGGFAKCYELKDKATGEIVAGKIVPKSMLTKAHQKEKMAQVKLVNLVIIVLRLSCYLDQEIRLLVLF